MTKETILKSLSDGLSKIPDTDKIRSIDSWEDGKIQINVMNQQGYSKSYVIYLNKVK